MKISERDEVTDFPAGDIARVGVVGCGQMGAGIAEVCARAGLDVKVAETTGEALEIGRTRLFNSLTKAAERGKITADELAETQARLSFTTDLGEFADRDLVIEAVVENEQVKTEIFQVLDQVVTRRDAILASNTSSIPLVKLAVATSRPDQVVGIHFFNPAPVQNLVEIVRTVVTEPSVLDDVTTFVERLGKNPVVCGDKAGFIANTLLFGYLNHAVLFFEGHYASREDIDAAMRFGCGYPMGPLALLDLIGLDTAYEILDTMYKQGRDRLHAPAPLLKQYVTAGLLGRKSGRGFYTYDS